MSDFPSLRLGLTALLITIPSLSQAAPEKTISFAMHAEPPQLNSTKTEDLISGFVLGHVMEGLLGWGKKSGEYVPGVATDWKVSAHEAVFHLRPNAHWSDGQPVTARDFVFGWRTVVDPKTAAPGAYFLSCIKNAEAITAGKAAPETLGVSAPDDRTLKVQFAHPCPYFAKLTPVTPFLPIREDFYHAHSGTYGSEANLLLYNGPFTITKWVHSAELELTKNASYWDSSRVKIDRVRIPYITANSSTLFNLFKNGDIDVLDRLSLEDLPSAQKERYSIHSFVDGSVWYMAFNFRDGRPTSNQHLRRAIAEIFDPVEYAEKIVGIPGTRKGRGLIPQWVKGTTRPFRDEYPIAARKPDLTAAKEDLRLAMRDLHLASPPSLVWLTGDTPHSAREAEYFQQRFKNTLGIELRIDKQIPKQRFAKMSSGDFDIVSAGWGVAYDDPMNFAELIASWNPMNAGHYRRSEYDNEIHQALQNADNRARMDAMARAERTALDDIAILPLFERVQAYLFRPGVEGVSRHLVGPDPLFTYATVQRK